MSKTRHRLLAWLQAVVVAGTLSACGGGGNGGGNGFFLDPSTGPIKSVIRTALPLGYAASVAMQAVQGNVPANTTVIGGSCGSYPCVRVVSIAISHGDLPLDFSSYGTITVIGLWASASQAILTTSFIGMTIGSNVISISSVALTPVITTASGVKVVYQNLQINQTTSPDTLSDAEKQAIYLNLSTAKPANVDLSVSMDAWIIEVDDHGTPTSYSDDSYRITGGSQGIDLTAYGQEILQLGILNLEMASACNQNPVNGLFLLNQISLSDSSTVIGQAYFDFSATCNGMAHVFLGLGNYLLATGKSYPLNLNTP